MENGNSKREILTISINWYIVYAMHLAILYGAFAINLEGAMYVLKFYVWFMATISLLFLVAKNNFFLVAKKKYDNSKDKKFVSIVRITLNWIRGFVTLLLLMCFGHSATAIAWLVVIIVMRLFFYEYDTTYR